MDIYSAARRFRAPFRIEPDSDPRDLPIGARAVIGDGHTCALVRVDGAIDWLCMPRFDSPSVFGQVLDPDGGVASITPVARPFDSLQRYDSDTNVLETLFTVPGQGVVRLLDYMPWTDDPRASIHEVHRRIDCLEGQVAMEAVFDPRFGYGQRPIVLTKNRHGVVAKSGAPGESMAAALEGFEWQDRPAGGVRSQLDLQAGQRVWCVLSWGAHRAERISAYRPFEHLRATRAFWRAWSQKLGYDGPWRHHVLRSALLLKLLIYAPTGAMVAAPTTSLPEWIGGGRNWDYRFAWARDASLGIRAANVIGYTEEAGQFFHFVRDVLDARKTFDLMVTIDGQPVPDEQTLDHLRGYKDSRPVRIGNGARDQLQLDSAGYLLDAALVYERYGGTLTGRAWRHLRSIVEAMREAWRQPDHGIWEPRGGVHHNVNSKVMSWVAFDRASKLGGLFGDVERSKIWAAEANLVREEIMEHGRATSGDHFVSSYGSAHMDSTLLLIPSSGFLPGNDPRVIATVDRVREALEDRGFLYRYRVDDGVGGDEGAFILCGFWLAEALAILGRVDEAQEVFVRHAEASNHVGLLSEEIDPGSGMLLGNFPQGFSHMGLINAAARIDLALRLRDEHSPKNPTFLPDL